MTGKKNELIGELVDSVKNVSIDQLTEAQHGTQALMEDQKTNEEELPGDPVSFEEWIKITEHLNASDTKGIDPAHTLAKYRINAADWSAIGDYWAVKINTDVTRYGEEFQKYSIKYSEQFENEF